MPILPLQVLCTRDVANNDLRLYLLNRIGQHLAMMIQWHREPAEVSWTQNVTEYATKAEALIEVLEVLDCGSVGGYDSGFDQKKTLFGRWVWLYNKVHDVKKFNYCSGQYTYRTMKKYFEPKEK